MQGFLNATSHTENSKGNSEEVTEEDVNRGILKCSTLGGQDVS